MDTAAIVRSARAPGQVRGDVVGEGTRCALFGITSQVVDGGCSDMLQVVERGLQGIAHVLRVELVKVSRPPTSDWPAG